MQWRWRHLRGSTTDRVPDIHGTPQTANLRNELRAIAQRASCPGRSLSRSHLFAAVAASKLTVASLSKVMGHRRVATTADLYAHLYERMPLPHPAAIADALSSGTNG